jgi:hypothetical protein
VEVLTDFDHMAQILSSVEWSEGVPQGGVISPLLRQMELTPKREIRSHLLKGDLKASDFSTRISEEGSASRITVRGKFVAGGLAASALTVEAVEAQTKRNYQELRDEILRRKSNEPPPACLLTKTCQEGSG